MSVTRTGDGIRKLDEALRLAERSHVEVGVDDPAVARYATWLEYGWVQRVTPAQSRYLSAKLGGGGPKAGSSLVMPPRPTFRQTFSAKARSWLAVLWKALARNPAAFEQAYEYVGIRARDDLKATIATAGRSSGGQFAERSGLTLALLDAEHGGHPMADGTGTTARSQPLVGNGTFLNSIRYRVVKR